MRILEGAAIDVGYVCWHHEELDILSADKGCIDLAWALVSPALLSSSIAIFHVI